MSESDYRIFCPEAGLFNATGISGLDFGCLEDGKGRM